MNFIDDLGVSIVFFFNGDARLGSGLLQYEIFRGKVKGNVFVIQKKKCEYK
jgi:hypothetical protein